MSFRQQAFIEMFLDKPSHIIFQVRFDGSVLLVRNDGNDELLQGESTGISRSSETSQ